MTEFQRVVKYVAIGLAILLTISIVLGIINLIGGIFMFKSGVLDDFYEIEISQNIKDIELDINAASLKIIEGDKFALSTNIEKLNVTSRETKLYLQQSKRRVFFNYNSGGEIILTVPKGTVLDSFDLEAGAGSIEIAALECIRISLDCGAGNVNIAKLVVSQSAEIDTGAGNFIVRDGRINNLDFDVGVGKTDIHSFLTGDCAVNSGVGDLNLEILAPKEEYSVKADTGIGSLIIDGVDVKNSISFGNGANRLRIEGGVGSIDIKFSND